jgi:putative endonuclease
LFFRIEELSYDQARKIEKHIKNMKSRSYYYNLKKYPAIVEKLKNKYSS